MKANKKPEMNKYSMNVMVETQDTAPGVRQVAKAVRELLSTYSDVIDDAFIKIRVEDVERWDQ